MNSEHIKRAARALNEGALVAFPTETVYGLGADAENPQAVARIYSVKGRPADHPLIVHLSSGEQVTYWAEDIPDFASKLAKAFWPGPMTLILNRTDKAKDFITGGQDTVGVRVPHDEVALALLSEFAELGGRGVAAPSANKFGKVSPTTASAVREELADSLGSEDIILEGAQSHVGIESTIIDCTSEAPRILRPGAITSSMIEEVTGLKLNLNGPAVRVSGSLESHYAPRAAVVLDQEPQAGEGMIALSNMPTPPGVVRLAAPGTTAEYANQLYSALRQADELGLNHVVAFTPTGDEMSLAILDRLQRASSPSRHQ